MKPENRPKIEFEGKEYDDYQATQMQRKIERTIRRKKREVAACEAAGLTDEAAAAKSYLRRLNQEYRDFSRAAGLPEQRERMRVLYGDGVSAKKAAKALEKYSDSGIIDTNRSREIPEVSRAAAVIYPAEQTGKTGKSVMRDVTEEYINNAAPNSHIVQDLHTYMVNGTIYTVDGHNVVLDHTPHEKEIAELLERKLGGEFFMVPRVNEPQGVRTPDYLFRGEAYDLKTLSQDAGPNTIFNRVKKAAGQAHRFIIDVTRSGLGDATLNKQIEKLFNRSDTYWVEEIFIIRGDTISRIIKRA